MQNYTSAKTTGKVNPRPRRDSQNTWEAAEKGLPGSVWLFPLDDQEHHFGKAQFFPSCGHTHFKANQHFD